MVTIIHFGCWFEFVKLVKKIYAEKYLGYSLFGLIYITMPVLMMFPLQGITISAFSNDVYDSTCFLTAYSDSESFRFTILMFTIAVIWINDTMAYIVGSFFGKTPFSKISPKKTWEGTGGGALLAVGAAALFASFLDLNIFLIVGAAATIAISGTTGDLLESKLKRMANVKDSGSFMPGHGGFLDRFDSLLVAVPAVWAYVYFIM